MSIIFLLSANKNIHLILIHFVYSNSSNRLFINFIIIDAFSIQNIFSKKYLKLYSNTKIKFMLRIK